MKNPKHSTDFCITKVCKNKLMQALLFSMKMLRVSALVPPKTVPTVPCIENGDIVMYVINMYVN